MKRHNNNDDSLSYDESLKKEGKVKVEALVESIRAKAVSVKSNQIIRK